MNTTDVGATLREMWETRPARPRHDRKIAGVAAAIARRYDIDPVLVRVGFAVAAFYGIGLALYLAGWILLPGADAADPSDGAAPSRTERKLNPLLIVLLVLVLLGSGGLFWGDHGGFVLPVLATLALLFVLHRSRGARGVPGGAAAAPAGTPGGHPEAPTTALRTDGAEAGATTAAPEGDAAADPLDRGEPPAWDPLGAAPFAWDLPEPAEPTPPPAPVRHRSRVTPLFVALALVGGGIASGVVLLSGFGPAALPTIFATVLAILGVGLVVGAFVRGGRGLIPLALLMMVLTWASLAVQVPLQTFGSGTGEVRFAATSTAALPPTFEHGAGSMQLDLSALDTSVPEGTDSATLGPIPVRATLGLGELIVRVPADADVTVRAHTGAGQVSFGNMVQAGPNATIDVADDLGADGVRSGRPIVLDLTAGFGEVEVVRG